MKKEKLSIINENNIITIKKWKGILYVPIPLVKTLGFYYHLRNKKSRKVIILAKGRKGSSFTLSLLLSSSLSDIKMLNSTINYFIEFLKQYAVKEINAVIVNKRISDEILERYGWKYYKKNWYIGKCYKLKL